jgi:hypothetical protein
LVRKERAVIYLPARVDVRVGGPFAKIKCERMGAEMPQNYIQIAEIDVDPAQLDGYKAAVKEQIEAANPKP